MVLRSKGKSCQEFETMVNSLTFEELISLKLELSLKWTNKKLFGYPILKSFHHIGAAFFENTGVYRFRLGDETNLCKAEGSDGLCKNAELNKC